MALTDPLPPAYDEIRRLCVDGTLPCRDAELIIAEGRRDFDERAKELTQWAATHEVPVPMRPRGEFNPATIPVEIALMLLFGGFGMALSGWLFLGILALSGVVLVYTVKRGGGRRQLKAAQQSRLCPKCEYDLQGIITAKDPRVAELLTLTGPFVCPECGTEWPLVPRLEGGTAMNPIKIN